MEQFNDFESELEEDLGLEEINTESSMKTKLERRRRIEEIMEERRLRAELEEF